MKITFAIRSVAFEVNVETYKIAFEAIAKAQEIFGETECGKCKSKDIRLQVRKTSQGSKFFEYRCNACPAQLDVGTAKEGPDMWIKRWDKETKKAKPDRGWFVWEANSGGSGLGDAHEGPAPGNGGTSGESDLNGIPF